MKDKIKKLLALGNDKGATEHEAARALEMAHALMLKYNITIEPDAPEAGVCESPIRGKEHDEMWHRMLAGASCYLYSCKNIVWSDRDCDGGKYFTGFKFVGRADSIDAAWQTFEFLVSQVEALYKINLPAGMTKSERSDYRRSFKYACANRVAHRIHEMMEAVKKSDAKAIAMTGCTALVVVDSIKKQLDDIEQFCKENLKTKTLPAIRSRRIGAGTGAGRVAGEHVKIHKEVSK